MCSDSGVPNSFITSYSPFCLIMKSTWRLFFLSQAMVIPKNIQPMRGREVKRGVKLGSKGILMGVQMAVTILQKLQKHKNNPQ